MDRSPVPWVRRLERFRVPRLIDRAMAAPGFSIGLGALLLLLPLAEVSAQGPHALPQARSGPPRFHDPSTPVRERGEWWVFSTGNGLLSRRSNDLTTWREGPPVFKEFPAWHREVVPSQRGHLWAPDLVFHDGLWRLYYSVSSFGKNTSAIGLVTSPSLDPADPRCHWRDMGIVIRSGPQSDFNAIDPHVVMDGGRHWMSFGSFWGGIQLLELSPETGLAHPERGRPRRIAWNESIEAPAILRHGGFYHLFVNWGFCCRGVKSTYEIRTGRSRSITGPYLDKDGRDMAAGGGSLLLATRENRIGPGHPSFLEKGGQWSMFHHFYDASRGGRSDLHSVRIEWIDGWPVVR